MLSSRSIALVRASGFGSLPELLEERAGEPALLETFENEGVPIAVRDAPATPIPLTSMMALFSRGAHRLGDRTFGLDVGEHMTHRAYGLWVEYSIQVPTLGDALRRAVTTSWAHQSGARLELVTEGEHSVLRFVTPLMGVDKMQHSDHLLPPMLSFARLYLGRNWQPDWYEANYPRDGDAGLLEDRLLRPIRFGRPGVGIALKTADLSRKRKIARAAANRIVTLRDVQADVLLKDAPEPARLLSAVVGLRLLDGHSDIEGAALLVGMSVQALQRRLRQKGYTYREILEAARCDRAVRLLRETRLPVLQIALSLGYEDHANFTRAFIRWTGSTPSEIRRSGALTANRVL